MTDVLPIWLADKLEPLMPDHSRFWNKIAEKYASRPIEDPEAYQRKLAETQALLKPDMRLLEIGCGTGGTAIAHAPYVARIDAVDISENMLAIARAKAADAGVEKIRFETAAIDGLSLEAESYNMVLALSILHLLEDRGPVIERIYDWLKPGGYFISSTVCLRDHMAYIRFIFPLLRPLGLVPLVRVFGEAELIAGIQEAGFVIEKKLRPKPSAAVFIIARKPG